MAKTSATKRVARGSNSSTGRSSKHSGVRTARGEHGDRFAKVFKKSRRKVDPRLKLGF
jgi:hypothetical protein